MLPLLLNMMLWMLLPDGSTRSLNLSFQKWGWTVPASADTLTNSNVLNPEWVTTGKIIYQRQCIVCHGTTGKGDGESGFGLDVPPGDLTDKKTTDESDGSLFWKITNGRKPMPAFYYKLSEKERWQTISYIRFLQRNSLIKRKRK